MTTIITPPSLPATTVETDSTGSAIVGTIIGIALVAAIGYGIYAFSNGPTTVIEHNTDTSSTVEHTITTPSPTPTVVAPVTVTPPATPAPEPAQAPAPDAQPAPAPLPEAPPAPAQ